MTPKERVVAQIKHEETDFIPYRLRFEEDGDKTIKHGAPERVNSYYKGDSWRAKLDNHIVGIPTACSVPAYGPRITTDMYGTQWRMDKRPMHIEKPALDKPSLSGYRFPNLDVFFSEGWYERALKLIDEKRDHFLVTGFGLGLFERSWAIRGFENALMDSVAHPDFYQELIEGIFEQYMALLDRVLSLPTDGFMFGDDFGHQDGIIIGAERWQKYFKPYYAKMYAKAHQAGKYTLQHMCGSIAEILPSLLRLDLMYIKVYNLKQRTTIPTG